MSWKNKFIAVTIITLLAILSCTKDPNVAGTISETEGGLMGIVVSAAGVPQEGVSVALFNAEDTDTPEEVADTVTNERGEYYFPSVPSGEYYVEGVLKKDSVNLTIRVDGISYDSVAAVEEPVKIGTDTLTVPGYISGKVTLQNDQPLGVLVYIPGTSYQAYTDQQGEFQFSQGIAEGDDYTLIFSFDGYLDEVVTGISVTSGDTMKVTPVGLPVDPETVPHAPTGLTAQYDEITQTVKIQWEQVTHPSLDGYVIFRKDSAQSASAPTQLNTTVLLGATETLYTDQITDLAAGDTVVYQYQLKSQHTNSEQSSFSTAVFVTVGMPKVDTVVIGSPAFVTDAYIVGSIDNGATGFSELNYAKRAWMRVGEYDDASRYRVLLHFDLYQLAGEIETATLVMTSGFWVKKHNDIPMTINVHQMLTTWNEGAGEPSLSEDTWNGVANTSIINGVTGNEAYAGKAWSQKMVGINGVDADSVILDNATHSISDGDTVQWSFDVTSMVQSWISGTEENYGLLLKMDDEGRATYDKKSMPSFYTWDHPTHENRAPKLIITLK